MKCPKKRVFNPKTKKCDPSKKYIWRLAEPGLTHLSKKGAEKEKRRLKKFVPIRIRKSSGKLGGYTVEAGIIK